MSEKSSRGAGIRSWNGKGGCLSVLPSPVANLMLHSQHHLSSPPPSPPASPPQSSYAELPVTLEIFTMNGAFRGTFYLHDYLGRANPRGVLPDCIQERGDTRRLKPSDAEVRAGNGSFKNWKVSFKTTYRGQMMSIKDLLDMHQLK